MLETRPHQVTLVPDELGQITSDHGWDTVKHRDYLKQIIPVFRNAGIRVSIFVDPVIEMVEGGTARNAATNDLPGMTATFEIIEQLQPSG